MTKKLLIWILVFLALISFASAVQQDDIIYHWSMDNANYTGGELRDSVGSGDLDLQNSPSTGLTGLVTGESFGFDGTNQYLNHTAFSEINYDKDFSVSITVNLSSVTPADFRHFFYNTVKDSAPRERTSASVFASKFRFTVDDLGTTRDVSAPATIGVSHIVLVHDATANTVNIIVNGTNGSTSDTAGSGLVGFSIGAKANPSNYWDGEIDDVCVWNRTLTETEANQVFSDMKTGTSCYQPAGSPAVDGNASFSGGINFNPASPDEDDIVQSNATLYTDNSGGANITVTVYLNDTYQVHQEFNDSANNTDIQFNFSCITYSCTNGDLLNFTYEGTVGNDKTNTSAQVEINNTGNLTITVYERITGTQLSNFNLTAPQTATETGFEMNISGVETGSQTITGVVEDYINTVSNTTTVVFNTNTNAYLSGFYNTNLTILFKEAGTGTSIENFSGFINYSNGYMFNFSTTTENVSIGVIDGLNYTVYVSATDYNSNLTIHNATGVTDTLTLYAYKLNTVIFNFFEQENRTVINDRNITLEVISDVYANNYSTDTGALTVELLEPSNYTMRYYANEYTERFYYLDLDNNTFHNLSLYLIKEVESTNVTVTIIDETGSNVESATVKVLKYYLDTNTYITQEVGVTNTDGEVFFDLTLYDEYYRFIVEYDGETVKTTNPTYLTSNSITIQVILNEEFAEEFTRFKNLDYSLTYNDATDNFRFTYNNLDGSASKICLYVYTYNTAGKTQLNSSCATTSAGTLLAGINPVNDTIYSAEAYYYMDSEILITTLQKEYSSAQDFGSLGLIGQILLTGTLSLLLFFLPELAVILIPASLIFGRAIQLTNIPYTYLMPLLVVGFIISFILSRRSG